MDKLDVHILRVLAQGSLHLPSREGINLSKRGVAKILGVSEGTIRYRMGKMISSGLLRGSNVFPNPALLGLSLAAYGFDVFPSIPKKEIIDNLKSLERVVVVQNHHGDFVGVVFAYTDDSDLKRAMKHLNMWKGHREGIFSRILFPPCSNSLGVRDWELVSLLARGKFGTYAQMADELGVSVRTLKRMLAESTTTWTVFSLPVLDYRAMQPGAPADLVVLFTKPAARVEAERRILRLVDDFMFYVGIWEDQGLYSLIVPNPGKATELVEEVRKIPGVRLARMELVDEHFDKLGIFAEAVEKRMRTLRVGSLHGSRVKG